MAKKVIGIAAAAVGKKDDVLVSYALGSCVGICLYDPIVHVGGLVHILLPDSHMMPDKPDVYRYADTAIPALYHRIQALGASRNRIVAKITGGAKMFACSIDSDVGNRNVQAVHQVLKEMSIPIQSEDVEKNYGRSIWFYCEDGHLYIRSARNINIVI